MLLAGHVNAMVASTLILNQVSSALEFAQLPRDRKLLIALSGGLDSQVLTHALLQVAGATSLHLKAVHIDHGLRPTSAADARRVEQLCRAFKLEYESVRVDVAAWDRYLDQGTEAAAREARYAALARVANADNATAVALGHTLDDQAETIVMRLVSGTGLEGLGGMETLSYRAFALEPGERRCHRIGLLRPLLNVARKAIREYAVEHGIEPIEDETNESLAYRRNAIRKNILPALESIDPAVRTSISRTAQLLREDAQFIAQTVDEHLHDVVAERADMKLIDRARYRRLPGAIQRRILYRVLDHLLTLPARFAHERIGAVRNAIVDGRPGSTIELPGHLVAYVDYDRVAIGHGDRVEQELRRLSWVPLLEPGSVIRLAGVVDIKLENGWIIIGNVPGDGEWNLRTRRPGDRIRFSDDRTVKLQDWLVNRKVPRYIRDWLPLVTCGSEVRWVIGLDSTEFGDPKQSVWFHMEIDTDAPNSH